MSRTDTLTFRDTDTDAEFHAASATAHLLDELQLCGHRPGQDEPDPRPLPEPDTVCGQLNAAVEALSAMLPAPASRTISPICCGRLSTSSTARPSASSASSTSTSRPSARARPSRTAPR